jgi:hypothetical protein
VSRHAAFFAWLDEYRIGALGANRTHHVSTQIETLTRAYRAPTVKQHLAALRMLFDWLIGALNRSIGSVGGSSVRRELPRSEAIVTDPGPF